MFREHHISNYSFLWKFFFIPGRLRWTYCQVWGVAPSSKLSTVVDLSYRDAEPERCWRYTNGLIETYEQSTIEENLLAGIRWSSLKKGWTWWQQIFLLSNKSSSSISPGRGAVDIGTQRPALPAECKCQRSETQWSEYAVVGAGPGWKICFKDNSSGAVVPSTVGSEWSGSSGLVDKLYIQKWSMRKWKQPSARTILRWSQWRRINKLRPVSWIISPVNARDWWRPSKPERK